MRKVRKSSIRLYVLGWLFKRLRCRAYERSQKPSYWISKIDCDDASVVQIGSNDGKQGDPLYEVLKTKPTWRALFVEPVPYLFDRLKLNYAGNNRYQFACTAINNGETAVFYHVDPQAKEQLGELPFYYDQLGSFDRNHIVKQLDGILEPFIRETVIQGMRLSDLFVQHGIEDLTVLHIDTEGHDWEVLKQLDLNRYQPQIILYEHTHLSEQDKDASIALLASRYDLFCLGPDILALNKSAREIYAASIWKLSNDSIAAGV